MKSTLLTLLVLIGSQVSAQAPCPCVHKLDTLIDMISRDYAGYYDKVQAVDRTGYNTLVDSLRKAAHTAVEEEDCTELQEAYCSYFQDKQLRMVNTLDMLIKRNSMDPPPIMTGWTRDSLLKYFGTHAAQLHEMEGVWKLEAYEFGLLYKDVPGRYQAVIMRSPYPHMKEGMVKFILTLAGPDSAQLDYWRADMKFTQLKVFRSDGHLSLGEMGVLHRTVPSNPDTLSNKAFELAHGHEVQWRIMGDSTLYIKIGSCTRRNQAIIDSLVNAHTALLDRIPAWIIDVRQNAGGSTAVFQNLLPYLYTRSYRSPAWKYWLSPENIRSLEPKDDPEQRSARRTTDRSYARMLRYAEDHPNTWSTSWSTTYKFDQVKPFPRRIAILTDVRTAHHVEFFLLGARGMSERTIIVGENTSGMLDYCVTINRSFGPDNASVRLPIARMDWLGEGVSYNRTGIVPDVPLPPGTADPISFVQAWWAAH